MRINCGLTWDEKRDAWIAKGWHPWFAWFPVRIGHRDCRWFETIERRVIPFQSIGGIRDIEYRLPAGKEGGK